MRLRRYEPVDKAACLNVFATNVPEFFAAEERAEFSAFLDQPPGPYFVVEAGQTIVACGGYAKSNDQEAVLCWGMVARDHHKRGLGKFLLRERINLIFASSDVQRVVARTSQHSADFFIRFGFTRRALVENGFAPGIDRVEVAWQHPGSTRDFCPPIHSA